MLLRWPWGRLYGPAGASIITPVQYNDSVRKALLVGLMVCAACSPVASPASDTGYVLHAYATVTPSATANPSAWLVTASQVALPSPTPFTYIIHSGDTMGSIADKLHVPVAILMQANPDVDPNSMRVGAALQIPSDQDSAGGDFTPTPVPLSLLQANCYPDADRSLSCFVLVRNDSPDPVEDVTAQISLVDAKGAAQTSGQALLPLDTLPPGQLLPLTAFFAPPLPTDLHPQVQLLTAIGVASNSSAYLNAVIESTQAQIAWSGRSAQVSGQVRLPEDSRPAKRVWVAAVAYDGDGNVTGVRRWESAAALQPGGSLPFSFELGSLSGEIVRIDCAVEARP